MTGQTTIAASTATTSLPNGRIVTALFAGALFLSAFLLFVLEPMVAKSILPRSAAHRWRMPPDVVERIVIASGNAIRPA